MLIVMTQSVCVVSNYCMNYVKNSLYFFFFKLFSPFSFNYWSPDWSRWKWTQLGISLCSYICTGFYSTFFSLVLTLSLCCQFIPSLSPPSLPPSPFSPPPSLLPPSLLSPFSPPSPFSLLISSDPNTLFRGNSVASKVIDEFMKETGQFYLHRTLQPCIDEVSAVYTHTHIPYIMYV